MPRQGWLYLSINHLCFYSFMLGKESKIIVRWVDVKVKNLQSSVLGVSGVAILTELSSLVIFEWEKEDCVCSRYCTLHSPEKITPIAQKMFFWPFTHNLRQLQYTTSIAQLLGAGPYGPVFFVGMIRKASAHNCSPSTSMQILLIL